METRCQKLVVLCQELARSPHEPLEYGFTGSETWSAVLSSSVLGKMFSFCGSGSLPAAVCRRWRAAVLLLLVLASDRAGGRPDGDGGAAAAW